VTKINAVGDDSDAENEALKHIDENFEKIGKKNTRKKKEKKGGIDTDLADAFVAAGEDGDSDELGGNKKQKKKKYDRKKKQKQESEEEEEEKKEEDNKEEETKQESEEEEGPKQGVVYCGSK